jgi:hypothetical protein
MGCTGGYVLDLYCDACVDPSVETIHPYRDPAEAQFVGISSTDADNQARSSSWHFVTGKPAEGRGGRPRVICPRCYDSGER